MQCQDLNPDLLLRAKPISTPLSSLFGSVEGTPVYESVTAYLFQGYNVHSPAATTSVLHDSPISLDPVATSDLGLESEFLFLDSVFPCKAVTHSQG